MRKTGNPASHSRKLGSVRFKPVYFFFAAFTLAHLARCAAAIFLRADADMVRLGFILPAWSFAPLFAHRAFCARLIRLRAEADMVPLSFV